MPYYRGTVRDTQGNSVAGASVTIFNEGLTTKPTIYSNADHSTTQSNPITTDASGTYDFWVPSGIFDITTAATGFTTVTIEDVVMGGLYASIHCASSAAVAQSTSYTPLPGTWTDNALSQNAFTHSSGCIVTYTGDATVKCLVTLSGGFDITVSGLTSWGVAIDGTVIAAQDMDQIYLTNLKDVALGLTWIVEVEKDETISVESKVASGTPNITTNVGANLAVVVLA